MLGAVKEMCLVLAQRHGCGPRKMAVRPPKCSLGKPLKGLVHMGALAAMVLDQAHLQKPDRGFSSTRLSLRALHEYVHQSLETTNAEPRDT